MKYYYIYKTTCCTTGRYYIGMHTTTNLDDGYLGSGKYLKYSIAKYGIDSHTKEILEFVDTRQNLVAREKELVTKSLLEDVMCMNLMEGGTGGRGFTSEQQRLNAIKSNAAQKYRKEIDPEYAEERFKRASERVSKSWETGTRTLAGAVTPEAQKEMTVRAQSEAACLKRRETQQKTGFQQGVNNSQYGTIWVTNDLESLRIKKEQLDEYLILGYRKGRVMMNKRKKVTA